MVAGPYSIDPTTYLDELLAQASPDLMREMTQGFINQILSTQADQVCDADYAAVSQNRDNTRNGYRHRNLDAQGHRRRCRAETAHQILLPRLVAGDWYQYRRLPRVAGHAGHHIRVLGIVDLGSSAT